MSLRAALLRLAVFAAVMIALLVVVAQAIQRPVPGETTTFRAVFTDVSGLKSTDIVRMYGVPVGKVTRIALSDNKAEVEFTVLRAHPIYDASVLAIRYQSLTGQRYVDIRQPDQPGQRLASGATIDTGHTVPSFDITQLFNGLQPVLREISPGAINKFAENVLAVIQGDGSGIGPALDSLQQLSQYVSNRQAVISTIIANLAALSGAMGGRSPYLTTMLTGLADVASSFQTQLDGVLDFAAVAPDTLAPLNALMADLGFTEPDNPDLRRLFPDPQAAVDLLGKLPGLLQSLDAMLPNTGPAQHVDLACSKGQAEVPGVIQLLIGGQRIAICNS
nr:MCE family protein [Nocardia sp.]